jgi:hypothetical protein
MCVSFSHKPKHFQQGKIICFKYVDSGDHISELVFAHQSVFRLLAAVTELSLG